MPSDVVFRLMNRTHKIVLQVSGGRLGWFIPGYRMPAIQLTTIGRKTGQPRTTMLTSPYQDGATIVLVASAGGNDQHPAWYLNLVSNPDVTVSFQGKPAQRMQAVTANAEERGRLWPIITQEHPHYAGYQRKTNREIPLVLLTPAS